MQEYLIKIWENEDLRNSGLSDIIETNIIDIKEAIKKAKDLMAEHNYASIEVQTEDEQESVYYNSSNEEKYFYNLPQKNIKDKIRYVVQMYFAENCLNNLMDYGSDRDSLAMPSLSSFYSELLEKIGIKIKDIQTEDISDGKYATIIEFDNGNKTIIDTKANNKENVIIDNLISIQEEYEKSEIIIDNDMEME